MSLRTTDVKVMGSNEDMMEDTVLSVDELVPLPYFRTICPELSSCTVVTKGRGEEMG